MLLSVCIATFRRPELLAKLLTSLAEQKFENEFELEIIIVDNDEQESAREIINSVGSRLDLRWKYYSQPVKNISLTRNIAVSNANGEYILFIDDDEIASPEWIKNIYTALLKYRADAVFGRVVSYFDDGTPDWIRNCFIYNRPSPPTGTSAVSTRTGNVIVKSSLLKSIPGPFDPEYGITGGSDTKLFSVLKKKGAKYINCREAVTYEYVPGERAKLKWLVIRAFRTGNNFVRRQIESKEKLTLFIKIKYTLIGFTYSIASLFLSLIFVFNKTKRANWFLKFFANLGKLTANFGYYPKEY